MPMDDDRWADYYAYVGSRPVRPLFARALQEYGEVMPGAVAVDLGCGSGIETRALLEAGFAVTAVDSSDDSMRILGDLPDPDGRLTAVHRAMQDADLPSARLVYAGFSLPFCPPERFDGLWSAVRTAVDPGGVLAVDLFGVRDAWADEPDLTFVTRERVLDLLAGLDVRSVHEIEEEGQAFAGPKHWHRFELVARA